jgi:hypothetical protein
MTDRSKFEQMLEHLVNEDQEAAKEIFHQIVVEKSREIYETILAEEFDEVEEKEEDDEEVEEAMHDDDEEVEEDFAFGEGDDDSDAIGGDPTDDMIGDIDSEEGDDMDMGDEEGSDDLEDRVMDLEDAMDELRAQFEKELGGMGDDDMGDDMDMGDDDMDMGGDDMGKDMKMSMADDVSFMREYVEKVGGADYTKYGKMGDDGVNTKSIVAGKNDMGGTTANILGGGESTSGGTKGGLANPSTKEDNAGNVNVPGGKAGVKHLKKVSTPAGGDDGDKGAGSPLNGVKSRAK